MSTCCGGSTSNSCDNGPCSISQVSQESLASQIKNLITTLFGKVTKTIVNGRAVWDAPCSADTAQLTCFPRLADEGFICYVLRLINELGVYGPTTYNPLLSYCKHTMVVSGLSFYVSIQDVPVGISISNAAYWTLLLTVPAGPVGPTGPQGAPGTPGAGSAINYSTATSSSDVTLSDFDAVLFCEPAAPMTVTIPLMSTLLAGKWFLIQTNGADTVTIEPTAPDTINGAATYTLSTPDETAFLISKNTGNWYIA